MQDPGIIDYEWAGFVPGGREIVFAGRERGQDTRMYVRPLSGGPARAFTGQGVAVWHDTVSPDGSALAAPCGERWCLYPLAGGDPQPIAHTEGMSVVGWGDGETLYLRAPERLPVQLFRLHLPSGRLSPWREIAPADRSGVVGINHVCGHARRERVRVQLRAAPVRPLRPHGPEVAGAPPAHAIIGGEEARAHHPAFDRHPAGRADAARGAGRTSGERLR